MRKSGLKAFLWFVMVGTLCTLSQAEPVQGKDMNNDVLTKEVKSFHVIDASLNDVVKSMRQSGLRVCFEEGNYSDQGEKISVEFREQSVTSLLDEITGLYSDYNWKIAKDSSLIVIHPKGGSVLNWSVPSVRVKNRSIRDVFRADDVLNLEEHNIVFFYRGPPQPLDTLLNIELKDQPVSERLNILVSQVPGLCWTISANPKGKNILTFHFVKERQGQPLNDK